MFLQISHAQNAAKDHEMVAMEKEWIVQAILMNREKLLNSYTGYKNRSKYEKEFREYFLWVLGMIMLVHDTQNDFLFGHSSLPALRRAGFFPLCPNPHSPSLTYRPLQLICGSP